MAYRQYLDTRHYNMPWKNVAISGMGEMPKMSDPATVGTAVAVGAIVLGLGLVIDYFVDRSRGKMRPNARRRKARSGVFKSGDRVQLHPGTDRWMMGDRYGTVVRTLRGGRVAVLMDRSGKELRFSPRNLEAV